MKVRRLIMLSSAWFALGVPAAGYAQAAEPGPPGSPTAQGGSNGGTAATGPAYHDQESTEIVVTALRRERRDVLSGVSVLQGAALTQALRPTIGETLAHTPGVSATSFGPNASRPVLRGLQGERVRVLTDGIGSFDVSNTSVDHAVVVNPLLAERIEVLRGPEALLYGSSAIGGVVNVLDRRIPRHLPTEPVHIDAIATYGSAARERSGAASVDVPLAGKFVVHADGEYINTKDLHIGGFVLSRQARRNALATSLLPPDPNAEPIDFAGNAALRGRLPNSASKTWTVGLGAAYVSDDANVGASYSHYDSLYGVPTRFATLPGQVEDAPRLDVKQNRFDARAEVQTGSGFIQMVRARAGYAKYRHFELAPDGSVGTAFYNKGLEGRVELVQAEREGWNGASGVQYFSRDFNVIGDEAFLPKNTTRQAGIFTLQQFDVGNFKLEAGGRYEHAKVAATPLTEQPQFFRGSRKFDAYSGSVGASYGLGQTTRVGFNLSHTERAPAAEELFANGPHAGTEAFEVGDPAFRKERSQGVEAVFRTSGARYSFEASAYHNWFSNFIYEDLTGEVEDGLPVFQFRQRKARYYGVEAQGSVTLAKFGDIGVVADGVADYVHANIVGVGPAPRIPPLRLLGGLGVTSPKADGRLEVEYTDSQKRISPFETTTDSFTLVNAQVNIRPWGSERPLSFALSANNIFDVDARRHASFLKDFAPLAGRDFRITARTSF